MEQFFSHENGSVPPSLSSNGHLRFCNKSDLLTCLVAEAPAVESDQVSVTAKIFDGSAIVHSRRPTSATFDDYADRDFIPYNIISV